MLSSYNQQNVFVKTLTPLQYIDKEAEMIL